MNDQWPIELVVKAEELIQKWEDKLGPLKNLRADLFGPGGRLEGVRKITDGKKAGLYERDDVGTMLLPEVDAYVHRTRNRPGR